MKPRTLTVEFANANGTNPVIVDNWTSYSIKQDFFVPADEFNLTLEDDRADQLYSIVYEGQKLIFRIGNRIIMVGYLETIDPSYSHSGGLHLSLKGRDYLGVLNDSKIFPNLNTGGATTFQFQPQNTITQAITTIINNSQASFVPITKVSYPGARDLTDNPFVEIANEFHIQQPPASELTFSSGFGTGRGKLTRKNISRTSFGHLLSPEKGESYLGYIQRIIKRAGLNIKMEYKLNPKSINEENIRVTLPIYNFRITKDTPPVPFLIHNKNDSKNNVKYGKPHFSIKEQPSVLIMESTAGGPTFRKEQFKVVIVNELTGYFPVRNKAITIQDALPNVKEAITQLTNGKLVDPESDLSTSSQGGTGYFLVPPNEKLYQVSQDVAQILSEFARPEYLVDINSHTKEELIFSAYKKMAEYQNKFFNLEYEVKGHTYGSNHYLWTYDSMVNVEDDVFGIKNPMYIHAVTYSKSRAAGTTTKLDLHLPFIQSFFPYSNDPPDVLTKGPTKFAGASNTNFTDTFKIHNFDDGSRDPKFQRTQINDNSTSNVETFIKNVADFFTPDSNQNTGIPNSDNFFPGSNDSSDDGPSSL